MSPRAPPQAVAPHSTKRPRTPAFSKPLRLFCRRVERLAAARAGHRRRSYGGGPSCRRASRPLAAEPAEAGATGTGQQLQEARFHQLAGLEAALPSMAEAHGAGAAALAHAARVRQRQLATVAPGQTSHPIRGLPALPARPAEAQLAPEAVALQLAASPACSCTIEPSRCRCRAFALGGAGAGRTGLTYRA